MAEATPHPGFLEKMLGPVHPRQQNTDVRWVGDPVRSHLALLLNTRQGSVATQPDYGLPDVSGFYSEYPASMAELRTVVEDLIKKYEPRLESVKVRIVETDHKEFRVCFLITGEIDEEGAVTQVQYRTTISSNGSAVIGS
jgi:type VI secretion system protein